MFAPLSMFTGIVVGHRHECRTCIQKSPPPLPSSKTHETTPANPMKPAGCKNFQTAQQPQDTRFEILQGPIGVGLASSRGRSATPSGSAPKFMQYEMQSDLRNVIWLITSGRAVRGDSVTISSRSDTRPANSGIA